MPHGIRNISNNEAKLSKQALSAGAYMERERIIALLEAWVTDDNGNFDETLALIKGEQK